MPHVDKYQSAGAFSWICPAGVSVVKVECLGGGGNGAPSYGAGGGGGGGAYSKVLALPVTPGVSINGVVGAVATDTYFKDTSTCLAKAGESGSSGTGGQGGQASSCVGDVKYNGGNGGNGYRASDWGGGGGGGAAGPDGAGVNGSNSPTDGSGGNGGAGDNGSGGAGGAGAARNATGATGGSSELGGGGGEGVWNNGTGGAGGSYGAGGGGGNLQGGAGKSGQVIITYTVDLQSSISCSGIGSASFGKLYIRSIVIETIFSLISTIQNHTHRILSPITAQFSTLVTFSQLKLLSRTISSVSSFVSSFLTDRTYFRQLDTHANGVSSFELSTIFSKTIGVIAQLISDIGNYRVFGILYNVFPKLNRKNIDFSKKKGIITGKITRI